MQSKIPLMILVTTLICGYLANNLGRTMAMKVQARSGARHLFTMLNPKLALSYRELFGSDRTYWQFVALNVAYVVTFLAWALIAFTFWARQ